jgi:hypothetical protein
MSDFSLFFIGALISFIWAAAALGPFLYVASKAELDWRERKKQAQDSLAPLQNVTPPAKGVAEPTPFRR